MASNGFLKLVRGEKILELFKHPNCFTLLSVIAYRASRNGDGLERKPGEALIGDYENCGLSEREYRTAKKMLNKWNLATFKATNKGTVATLTDSSIYDINIKANDEQKDNAATNQRRTGDGQETTNNKDKNIKNERNKGDFEKNLKTESEKCFVCKAPVIFYAGNDGICQDCKDTWELIPFRPLTHLNILTPKQYLSQRQKENLILEYKAKKNERTVNLR